MKNNIGLKFAFRSTDIVEIKKILTFFGLDPEDEDNQIKIKGLENGECLFQDLYGRTAVIYIDPVFKWLFDAFDTRPPQRVEEEVILDEADVEYEKMACCYVFDRIVVFFCAGNCKGKWAC